MKMSDFYNRVLQFLIISGLRLSLNVDCLKVLRIVICKYKDLVVVWVLSFKETLFQPKIMK